MSKERVRRPEDAILGLSAIALLGIIVLSGMHTPVPDVVEQIALLAVGAAAGIAAPKSGTPPAP